MKMNSAQIQQTLHTLNAAELNAEAIPAEHPMISQLERLFGDHTYFLDSRGLNIVEPVEAGNDGRLGVVVNLASWTDSRAGWHSRRRHPSGSTCVGPPRIWRCCRASIR